MIELNKRRLSHASAVLHKRKHRISKKSNLDRAASQEAEDNVFPTARPHLERRIVTVGQTYSLAGNVVTGAWH